MSDYLAGLAARNINQSQGFRFLAGELRPRLASRFEPPTPGGAAWPEVPTLLEQVTEQESNSPGMRSTSQAMEVLHSDGEPAIAPTTHLDHTDRERRPTVANQPVPSLPLESVEQGREPLVAETVSTVAHPIEGTHPAPARQRPPGRLATHDREEDGALTKEHPSLPASPPSESASATRVGSTTVPELQPDIRPHPPRSTPKQTAGTQNKTAQTMPEAMIRDVIVERISDRVRLFQVERRGLSEGSTGAAEAHDQLSEPQPVERASEMQQPTRGPSDISSSQHLSVTNAVTQVENALANSDLSSRMPAPDRNRGVLHSALTRLSEPRDEAEPNAVPTVNVTIGRIEVRATPAPPTLASKPRSTPVMTLEEYLRRRATGGGS